MWATLPQKIQERFWTYVDRSGGPNACWPWLGYVSRQGYGKFRVGRKKRPAHAVAYEITNERPIPDGKTACHSCDDRYPPGDITYRRCCNPIHVWPGTDAENKADCVAKGRQASGDRNGSKVHPEKLVRGADWERTHPSQASGEHNGRARADKVLVDLIRDRHTNGDTVARLSRETKLSESQVRRIVRYESWPDG